MEIVASQLFGLDNWNSKNSVLPILGWIICSVVMAWFSILLIPEKGNDV